MNSKEGFGTPSCLFLFCSSAPLFIRLLRSLRFWYDGSQLTSNNKNWNLWMDWRILLLMWNIYIYIYTKYERLAGLKAWIYRKDNLKSGIMITEHLHLRDPRDSNILIINWTSYVRNPIFYSFTGWFLVLTCRIDIKK